MQDTKGGIVTKLFTSIMCDACCPTRETYAQDVKTTPGTRDAGPPEHQPAVAASAYEEDVTRLPTGPSESAPALPRAEPAAEGDGRAETGAEME
jgi:hypothetical protein